MNLRTERLQLRPFEADDCQDSYEIYRSAETCRFLLHEPWSESTKEAEFKTLLAENHLSEMTNLHLACQLEEKVIGDISIWYTDMKETVEIGFSFNPNFAGQGYATEAVKAVITELFSNKKVHRIQANLDARNSASAHLCQRVGMHKEAHFRQDYWNKGEWTDSFVYGLLESDIVANLELLDD
ncbi:acetyltransferase [Enterococcus sp. JM4C]|uniref:GNAT family N-acetyltransferase n=1 Tax=Candidatus Enterococcus huntleyi TaxID=1857217 RepID=UPI00137B62FC|nr:GNAT family N-acetyltransferase [Enterococcus sp. JM4C]KAF1296041.1 acetyltransferase [Enterococcus sp. JM4C]